MSNGLNNKCNTLWIIFFSVITTIVIIAIYSSTHLSCVKTEPRNCIVKGFLNQTSFEKDFGSNCDEANNYWNKMQAVCENNFQVWSEGYHSCGSMNPGNEHIIQERTEPYCSQESLIWTGKWNV